MGSTGAEGSSVSQLATAMAPLESGSTPTTTMRVRPAALGAYGDAAAEDEEENE